MNLDEVGQDILDAVLKFSNWSHNPTAAPLPITLAAKWEGPLPFFINNFESATYPILVVYPTSWPGFREVQLHQVSLRYTGVLNYLYKASTGENPFEKSREGISKICINIYESNRLGLSYVNDIKFGSLKGPYEMDDITQYLFGLQIAAATLDFSINTTLVL
ncbi:MAG: hypothetical protein BWY74_01043 [Firmicutes bacterium ADurb.Bin419]|nr:MAG: hypothetical protein BWY74_01043 [Firmicutes bacterium ADurb.Bin419]